jgi:hypothetical protein
LDHRQWIDIHPTTRALKFITSVQYLLGKW